MKRKGRAGGWHHAVLAHSLGCCTWAPCLGILAFPGWLTKHNHGLQARLVGKSTEFHGFSRLFTAFPNPFRPRNGGRSSGSSSDVPDFLTVLDLHLAEAEAESQVHLISPELPLPGLASVML